MTPYLLDDSFRPLRYDETHVLRTPTFATVLASGVYEDLRHSKPNKEHVRRIAESVGTPRLLHLSM